MQSLLHLFLLSTLTKSGLSPAPCTQLETVRRLTIFPLQTVVRPYGGASAACARLVHPSRIVNDATSPLRAPGATVVPPAERTAFVLTIFCNSSSSVSSQRRRRRRTRRVVRSAGLADCQTPTSMGRRARGSASPCGVNRFATLLFDHRQSLALQDGLLDSLDTYCAIDTCRGEFEGRKRRSTPHSVRCVPSLHVHIAIRQSDEEDVSSFVARFLEPRDLERGEEGEVGRMSYCDATRSSFNLPDILGVSGDCEDVPDEWLSLGIEVVVEVEIDVDEVS